RSRSGSPGPTPPRRDTWRAPADEPGSPEDRSPPGPGSPRTGAFPSAAGALSARPPARRDGRPLPPRELANGAAGGLLRRLPRPGGGRVRGDVRPVGGQRLRGSPPVPPHAAGPLRLHAVVARGAEPGGREALPVEDPDRGPPRTSAGPGSGVLPARGPGELAAAG